MTFSTSAVAVCCCSASARSRVLALHLVEQPRVLDGDRRLVGETLDELDLALRERLGLGPAQAENPDKFVVAHQRNHDDCAIAAQSGARLVEIVGVGPGVGEMCDVARARGSPGVKRITDRDGILARLALEGLRQAELRVQPASVAIPEVEGREGSATEFRRRLENGCRGQIQIERRAADHLQHVGGRGLLLQRLRQVARARLHLFEKARVLDGDHRLIGEGLDDLDFPVGEGDRLVSAARRKRRSSAFRQSRAPIAPRRRPRAFGPPAWFRLRASRGRERARPVLRGPLGPAGCPRQAARSSWQGIRGARD